MKGGSPFPMNYLDILQQSQGTCLANQSVRRSHGLPCTDLCNCDSCENQSEGTSDDEFDEKEDEVEITKYELEYGSSDND